MLGNRHIVVPQRAARTDLAIDATNLAGGLTGFDRFFHTVSEVKNPRNLGPRLLCISPTEARLSTRSSGRGTGLFQVTGSLQGAWRLVLAAHPHLPLYLAFNGVATPHS